MYSWGDEDRIVQLLAISENKLRGRNSEGVKEWPLNDEFSVSEAPPLGAFLYVSFDAAGAITGFQVLGVRGLEEPPVPLEASLVKKWAAFVSAIRGFFLEHDFHEIMTPTLTVSSGTETHIQPFVVETPAGVKYLPSSPEFALKKVLSIGLERIFELRSCFRNEIASPHHSPEFLMLEWYRAFCTPAKIVEDVRELFRHLEEKFPNGRYPRDFQLCSVASLFHKLGLLLHPQTSKLEWRGHCDQLGVRFEESDDESDLFWRIFIEKIEGNFPKEDVVVVYDFPPELAAYARMAPSGWADRFEVYYQGLELANCYGELTDSEEQESRLKTECGTSGPPIDKDFIACLRWGLPPSSGIAMGVERLFMAIFGVSDISTLPMQVLSRTFSR